MRILHTPQELHAWRKDLPGTLGFVPTMGALHEGHAELIRRSSTDNDATLVSIFVNPTQFNSKEDLKSYPRSMENDLAILEAEKCQAVFLPQVEELYPDSFRYQVIEGEESQLLCGPHRPGHFSAVLTVVIKLLNLAKANRAYFGEKDFQQLRLIEGMVKAFFIETQIVAVPTVREKSGLAMSSRNRRLSEEAAKKARIISQLLAKKQLTAGDLRAELESAGFEVDYVADHWNRRFVAAYIDGVRLIDNAPL